MHLCQLFYPAALEDPEERLEVDEHPALGAMLCLIAERYALMWPKEVLWDMRGRTPPLPGRVLSIDDLCQSMKIRTAGEVRLSSAVAFQAHNPCFQNVAARIQSHMPIDPRFLDLKHCYRKALPSVHSGSMGLKGLENPWTKGFLPHMYSIGLLEHIEHVE
jgi:hypothetical protein